MGQVVVCGAWQNAMGCSCAPVWMALKWDTYGNVLGMGKPLQECFITGRGCHPLYKGIKQTHAEDVVKVVMLSLPYWAEWNYKSTRR